MRPIGVNIIEHSVQVVAEHGELFNNSSWKVAYKATESRTWHALEALGEKVFPPMVGQYELTRVVHRKGTFCHYYAFYFCTVFGRK